MRDHKDPKQVAELLNKAIRLSIQEAKKEDGAEVAEILADCVACIATHTTHLEVSTLMKELRDGE